MYFTRSDKQTTSGSIERIQIINCFTRAQIVKLNSIALLWKGSISSGEARSWNITLAAIVISLIRSWASCSWIRKGEEKNVKRFWFSKVTTPKERARSEDWIRASLVRLGRTLSWYWRTEVTRRVQTPREWEPCERPHQVAPDSQKGVERDPWSWRSIKARA